MSFYDALELLHCFLTAPTGPDTLFVSSRHPLTLRASLAARLPASREEGECLVYGGRRAHFSSGGKTSLSFSVPVASVLCTDPLPGVAGHF
jgi:hypothetical protein